MNLKTAPTSMINKRMDSLRKRRLNINEELTLLESTVRNRKMGLLGKRNIILVSLCNKEPIHTLNAIRDLRTVTRKRSWTCSER